MLGAAEGPAQHHLQPVRRVRESDLPLQRDRTGLRGSVWATGERAPAAGGLHFRDRLRRHHRRGRLSEERGFPALKIVATEALQCPTLLLNGFGDHRIEGIGDKHVPWVHNVRNTDAVAAIDDEDCMRVLRLFNEPAGRRCLQEPAPTGDRGKARRCWASLHLQPAGGHQDRQVLRPRRAGRDLHRVHRFDGAVRSRGSANCGSARGLHGKRRGADYAGPLAHQGVDYFKELTYSGPKGDPQPEVLHVGGAAGEDDRGTQGAVGSRVLAELFEDEVKEFDQLIEEFNKEVGTVA